MLVEQAENALFEIHRELQRLAPEVELVPVIGDITDERRMRATFKQHGAESVLHAAAHKHVPMMEHNPGEAIKNNVFGTQCVADIAHELGVERFVMISTDKAVNPTSIMGASKRAYQREVVDLNYNDSVTIDAVVAKYSEEARAGIFGPFIDILNDSNYQIQAYSRSGSFRRDLKPVDELKELQIVPKAKRIKDLESKVP